jgi:hypothetical protein
VLGLALAIPAWAQSDMPFASCKIGSVIRNSVTRDADRTRLSGSPQAPVTIECDTTRLFADEVEWGEADETLLARGNVVLVQPGLTVVADRAELYRKTQLGTFHKAGGTVRLTDRQVERSLFGTLEPEVMFWGERLEKIGPATYRLTNGGFTTCAQPTPRWEMSGSSGTITLDKRAVLRNAILRVKNVPVFYVPLIYYPIGEDDRSTGFLLPTYSTSTVKGKGLSNAFFLVLGRSQDATFYHDWFSKAGQGFGAEYRFVSGPSSHGDGRLYVLDEPARLAADGITEEQAARRSYTINGSASQALPRGFHLFAHSRYYSNVSTQRLYQQSVLDSSSRDRSFGASLNGNIGRYRLLRRTRLLQ